MITFKKPRLLGKPYKLLKKFSSESATGNPFGKCSLCGTHGNHISKVNKTETLATQTGQIKLSKSLNCKDFGIYVKLFTLSGTVRQANGCIIFGQVDTTQKFVE